MILSVLERYAAPYRAYHNLAHINFMFRTAAELDLQLTEEQRRAVWFHDAVIDLLPDCEQRSAQLYLDCCGSDDSVDHRIVTTIINDTKLHVPSIHESAVVLDLDCAVLGLYTPLYNEYARDIRHEYIRQGVPLELFVEGRTAWLKSMLTKGALFHTEQFRDMFQIQAVRNLNDELSDPTQHLLILDRQHANGE